MPRAKRKGRRSAWTWGAQKGDDRRVRHSCPPDLRAMLVQWPSEKYLAISRRIAMVRLDRSRPIAQSKERSVKVIASSLRKGNIVEIDGKLGVIVSTENIHPGKGTPVTQMDVRRIADGVKVVAALQDDRAGRTGLRRGPQAPIHVPGRRRLPFHEYGKLRPGHAARPTSSAIKPPTCNRRWKSPSACTTARRWPSSCRRRPSSKWWRPSPRSKGQTASSSYKPAVLSNGVRTMVPPFVTTGTKIVVQTADGSYVERAKD